MSMRMFVLNKQKNGLQVLGNTRTSFKKLGHFALNYDKGLNKDKRKIGFLYHIISDIFRIFDKLL